MGFVASRLNLRLFVDGIEVPVIGARCTFSEGAAATAQVQVIATDQVYDICPRALITLFFYETHDYSINPNRTASDSLGADDLRRWKLLYMGELAGIGFQKKDGNRSAVLQCVDTTNYWDYIRQHYLNFRNGGVESFENAFLGVKNDRIKNFDVVGKDVHSNLFTWLSKEKFKDPITGVAHSSLYLGVQRVLREMFFSSTFYAQQFNRLRIGDTIVGVPGDQTAGKLFKLDFFAKFIKNRIGGAGGMLSARDMINKLLGVVFHTYTVVPCPMFDPEGAALGLDGATDPDLSNLIIERTSHVGASLNYIVIKPDAWFLAPPACNVIFPHMYNSIAYQRNFLQEPTRLFLRTNLLFGGSDKWLTERFYAPDFTAFNQQLFREGGYLERLAAVLMPHEEFVGVNPVFTWQSDLSAYAQKGARREYLAQLADYLFWKYRFSTRTLNLSGPFNPNLVPGYPGVVIDRVPTSTETARHFVGQIQTVVHNIDQSGGWTHMTMVAARTHDEQNDFDFQGRTLEELAVKQDGTGFIDDRYSFQRIGREVYRKLFGCDSIMDQRSLIADGETAELPLPRNVKEAVDFLAATYRSAVVRANDINTLTLSITQRPKATMVDILGIPNTQNAGTEVTKTVEFLRAQGVEPTGFLATATDLDAADHNSTYTVRTPATITVIEDETTRENRDVTRNGVNTNSIVETTEQVSRQVTTTVNTQASYRLQNHLTKRQQKVLAYLASLRFRGMRG